MREFSEEIHRKTKNEVETANQVHMANFDDIISPMFNKAK